MLKRWLQVLRSGKIQQEKTEAVVLISPTERRALLQHSRSSFAKGQYEYANELASVLLRADHEDNEALTQAGFCMFCLGNYRASVDLLQRAISCGSKDPQTCKFLADSFFKLGDVDAGLPVAELACARLPTDPMALYVLGSFYVWAERYAQAAEAFGRAMEYASRDQALLVVCGLSAVEGHGRAVLRRNAVSDRTERARNRLRRYLMSEVKMRSLSEAEGLALITLSLTSENFPIALQEADRLCEHSMLEKATAMSVGMVFSAQGDICKVIELYRQGVDEKNPNSLYVLGCAMVAAGGIGFLAGA